MSLFPLSTAGMCMHVLLVAARTRQHICLELTLGDGLGTGLGLGEGWGDCSSSKNKQQSGLSGQ